MKSKGTMLTSTSNKDSQHTFLFSLRSLQPKAKYQFNIQCNFYQKKLFDNQAFGVETLANNQNCHLSSLLPCFSKGSQSKLNAFCSISDQFNFQFKNITSIDRLVQKNKNNEEITKQIMQAKPRNKYCQICKQTFKDYLQHLQHPIHIKKFQIQCRNNIIDQLIVNLNIKNNQYQRYQQMKKYNHQEQQEINHTPCKIRVIQLENTRTPLRSHTLLSNQK